MTLHVIGSGFGRTGTMTMKDALGVLDLGPTHHMVEVMQNPEQLRHWRAIFAGQEVDWDDVFAGYRSQVDWPGASQWHKSMIAFPQARVIHTERPEEDWWNSFDRTIGKFFRMMDTMQIPPEVKSLFGHIRTGIIDTTFEDFTDKDCAIAAFRANNARVREVVPADRLLVFDVAQGWEPLCDFLGLPIPETPFPHHHKRAKFWDHFGGEPVEAVAAA